MTELAVKIPEEICIEILEKLYGFGKLEMIEITRNYSKKYIKLILRNTWKEDMDILMTDEILVVNGKLVEHKILTEHQELILGWQKRIKELRSKYLG
nr:hypothetical protein [uncultured Tyzzerella sp.]